MLRNVTEQLESIRKYVGKDEVDTLMKNTIENEEVTKAMQQNLGMLQLRRLIVDGTEVVRERFEKRTDHLGESVFTFYTRKRVK